MIKCLARLGLIFFLFSQSAMANLLDPTRPALSQVPPSSGLEQITGLEAIIISKNTRFAIFNGLTLRVGMPFAGFRVVAITPNTVHLEGPDGKMTLFLFNQKIKKPSQRRSREESAL